MGVAVDTGVGVGTGASVAVGSGVADSGASVAIGVAVETAVGVGPGLQAITAATINAIQPKISADFRLTLIFHLGFLYPGSRVAADLPSRLATG